MDSGLAASRRPGMTAEDVAASRNDGGGCGAPEWRRVGLPKTAAANVTKPYSNLIRSVRLSVEALVFNGSLVAFALF